MPSGQAGSIEREKELVQRYRSHRKFSKMHEHEARLERLQAERVEAPKSSRKLRLPGAALAGGGPARSGEVVVRIEDLVVGYLPGRGARHRRRLAGHRSQASRPRPVPRRPARRPDRDRGAERSGQDDAPPDDRGRPAADRRAAVVRQRGPDRVPGAASRRGHPRRDRHRRAPRGDPDHGRRGARLPGPVPVPRRRRVQGGPIAVGWRAVAARAGAPRDHAVEPAPARRADEPPRHSRPRGNRGVHDGVAGDAARRSATIAACSRRSARSCGSSTAGSPPRSTAAIGSGGPRWRLAGRSPRPLLVRRRRAGWADGRSSAPTLAPPIGAAVGATAATRPPATRRARRDKLSKDAYRRQKAVVDADLSRLGLRKSHLELAMADPSRGLELRRAAAHLQRARRRRPGPGERRERLARAGGTSAVTVRIGITGPIGCGKSTVAGWLEELGAFVIDADAVAREVTAPGEPTLEAVIERFGEAYRSAGRVARPRGAGPARLLLIRRPSATSRRSSIRQSAPGSVGPRWRTKRPGSTATVIEAIKLVEGGLAESCDEVWLVTCDPAVQRERLLRRDRRPADADQRIAAQGRPRPARCATSRHASSTRRAISRPPGKPS